MEKLTLTWLRVRLDKHYSPTGRSIKRPKQRGRRQHPRNDQDQAGDGSGCQATCNVS